MREPAKLGVSFSYCKSIIVFKSRTSLFYCFQVWIALFFKFTFCEILFQSHPTPHTGSCPPTTTAFLLFTRALMFSGCFTWTMPGSSRAHAFSPQRPSTTPKRSSHVTTSTWAKWYPQISKDAMVLFKQWQLKYIILVQKSLCLHYLYYEWKRLKFSL